MNDDTAPSAEDEAFRHSLDDLDLQGHLTRLLTPLTDEEREVLLTRFGLDHGAPRSIDDVAKHFELSREEVRAIEAAAMRKMRSPLLDPETYSQLPAPFTDTGT